MGKGCQQSFPEITTLLCMMHLTHYPQLIPPSPLTHHCLLPLKALTFLWYITLKLLIENHYKLIPTVVWGGSLKAVSQQSTLGW